MTPARAEFRCRFPRRHKTPFACRGSREHARRWGSSSVEASPARGHPASPRAPASAWPPTDRSGPRPNTTRAREATGARDQWTTWTSLSTQSADCTRFRNCEFRCWLSMRYPTNSERYCQAHPRRPLEASQSGGRSEPRKDRGFMVWFARGVSGLEEARV
jgi:hypothetical protein